MAKVGAVSAAHTRDLAIEYVPLDALKVATRNPKRHAQQPLQASIGRFGYVEPIIVDERTGRIVAGHGRRESLLAMHAAGQEPPAGVQRTADGSWLAPVVRGWASKSDADAEAYIVASNKHVELGGWDNAELATMLQEIDLEGTGFDAESMAALIADVVPPALLGDPDDVPDAPPDSYVEPGDLYVLGNHRILCGDATSPADAERVLDGALADICWTDPPWNVAIVSKGNRGIANDDLGDAFPGFCAAFGAVAARATKPGAALYVAMSSQEWPVVDSSLRASGFHWSATIVWAKDSLVMGRGDYHSQYEAVWYGWNASAARLHPLTDRSQSDLWQIDRPKRSEEHPTMKPVALVARALENSSERGAVVFEPFSGSGTTIVASEQTGRRCCAIEIEPRYVQVAIERWEALTGRKAEKA